MLCENHTALRELDLFLRAQFMVLLAQAGHEDERWAAVDGLRPGGRYSGNGGAYRHRARGAGEDTAPDTCASFDPVNHQIQ